MAALPNFLTSKGLTGDPGLPEILSPAAPQSMPDVAMPPGVSAPAPTQPPSHGFAQALTAALPIILATIARTRGGPLAGAAALEGYTTAQQHQRTADEAQRRYDAATALSEQDRQAKATAAEQKRQADLESFIEHQASILRNPDNGFATDPTRWAATVAQADAAARKIYGAAPGYVAGHPALQFSDVGAKAKAKKEAQARLDAVYKTHEHDPVNLQRMQEHPEMFQFPDKTTLADLIAAADAPMLYEGGKPVVPSAPAPKPGSEDEDAVIRDEIAIAQEKAGDRPLTKTETQSARLRGHQKWLAQSPTAVATAAVTNAPALTYDALRPDPATANKTDPKLGYTPNAIYQNAIVNALTGQLPPTSRGVAGMPGAKAIQNKASAMADAAGVSQSDLRREYAGAAAATRSMMTRYQFTAASAQAAHDNLQLAEDLAKTVQRTDTPLVNRYVQWATAELGGKTLPNLSAFETAIYTAVREYAKVTSGSAGSVGGITDSATKQADHLLNAAQTPGTFQAVADVMEKDMANFIAPMKNEIAKSNDLGPSLKRFMDFIGQGLPVSADVAPPPSAAAPVPQDITDYFKGKAIGSRVRIKETGETWELTKTGPVLVKK